MIILLLRDYCKHVARLGQQIFPEQHDKVGIQHSVGMWSQQALSTTYIHLFAQALEPCFIQQIAL